MSDPSANEPADPARAAVRSASARIAALEPAAAPRRSPWIPAALLAAATLMIALVGWLASGNGLGPGITLVDAAVVHPDGQALIVESGTVQFARDAQSQPRFDRIRIPALDAELIPTGARFEVQVDGAEGALRVLEGRVALVIGGAQQAEIDAGGSVRFDRDGLLSPPVAAADPAHPAPTQAVPARSLAAPPAPAGAVEQVAVADGEPIPAILVLLGASDTDTLSVDERTAVVQAAEQIGSIRALVPLAALLDAPSAPPELQPLIWYAIGRDREANGQLADALAAYERVPDGHWALSEVRLRSGRILAQLSEYSGAEGHLRSAVAAEGRASGAAGLALGSILIRDGEPSAALRAWRGANLHSAAYDQMRVKTKRLPTQTHLKTWNRELQAATTALAADGGWERALYDPTQTTAIVRERLRSDPGVIEIIAEHQALEELAGALSTTHDPELSAALARAEALHARAAELATKRALADLIDEIRRALPR